MGVVRASAPGFPCDGTGLIVASGKLKSITAGFAGRVGCTCLLLGLALTAAFAVLTRCVMIRQAEEALTEQARLCAASLVPEAGGQLYASIDRLRDVYEHLAAVAMLDAAGGLQTVYPDRADYRKAATAVLGASGPVAASDVKADDTNRELWGVAVALNGDDVSHSRKIIVLLAHDSFSATWATATALFAACAGLACVMALACTVHWFERRVADPLRGLGNFTAVDGRSREAIRPIDTQGWREMGRVVASLQWMADSVVKSDRQRCQVERATKWQLDDRQRGFDRQLRRAKDRAIVDPLTGLRNRSFLDSELEPLFKQHQESGSDLAVVMIDLDNFKHHNDTHGHAAGDDVLCFIGDLLKACLRPTDYAVRRGGDEFLLLLPDTSAEQAAHVTERLVRLFGQYASSISSSKPLSVSAGVASLQRDGGGDAQELVDRADRALYAAKRAGKNEVCPVSPT